MACAAALACGACGGGGADDAPRGAEVAIVGESVKLRADEALPARSAIFDGSSVRLRGARGEVLGVQVLRAAGAGPETAAIALRVDGARVDAFAVDHHDVRKPSTSMYGPSRGRGRYPDRLTPQAGPVVAARAAYFDVAIARDAAPGTYAGELTIGERRLPLALVIDAAEVPDPGAAPRVWGYYDASIVRRVHGVEGEAATLAIEKQYAALFRAHGVVASPELVPASWPARRELVAGLAYVPVLLPSEPSALAADVRAWTPLLAETDQRAFAIPIDEPRSIGAQMQVRMRARGLRAAGGGPAARVLYAVTHEPTVWLGDDIDVYISPFAVRPGAAYAAWTYNGTPPWAGAMILDTDGAAMRTWGWIAYRYRVPLWYVWDVLFWADRYHRGRQAMPLDLIAEPVTFDDGEDHGNLDGLLAFPGVLPSLRLKALRRGLQDRALLERLEACAGAAAAEAIAGGMVPRALGEAKRGDERAWPIEEEAWEAARLRVLDGIAACPNPSPNPNPNP